jgi:hypothetical protein
MSTPEVPNRVIFMNAKDGNAFFDCTPQEARRAIQVVKEVREVGEYKAFKKENQQVTFVFEEAKRLRDKGIKQNEKLQEFVGNNNFAKLHDSTYELYPCHISTYMHIIERTDKLVTHIFMNAREYADFRLFDKGFYTQESQACILNTNVFANLWGAKIVVKAEMKKGEMLFVAAEDLNDIKVLQANITRTEKPEKPIKTSNEDINHNVDKLREDLTKKLQESVLRQIDEEVLKKLQEDSLRKLGEDYAMQMDEAIFKKMDKIMAHLNID